MQIGLDLGLTTPASTGAMQSRGPQKQELKNVGDLKFRPLPMPMAQRLTQDDANPSLNIYRGIIQFVGSPPIDAG